MWIAILVASAFVGAGAASTPIVLPLAGNYSQLFFWYTTVRVGAHAYTATIDSGSSDLLMPALGCNGCIGGNPTGYYNASGPHAVACKGQRLRCSCGAGGGPASLCDFNVTYGGALTLFASAANDRVSIAPGVASTVFFGATYNVSQPQLSPLWRRRVPSRRSRLQRQSMQDYPEGMWGLAFASINALGTAPMLDTVTQRCGGWACGAAADPAGQITSENHLRNTFTTCMRSVGGVMQLRC